MSVFLGNDIVDLCDIADLRIIENKRFIERVFNAEEQNAIRCSSNSFLFAWALWAAKEAAFKSQQKITGQNIFKHSQYLLMPETLALLEDNLQLHTKEMTGFLSYENMLFIVQWQFYPYKIHCLSMLNSPKLQHQVKYRLAHQRQWQEAGIANPFFSVRERQSIRSQQTYCSRYFAKLYLQHLGFSPQVEIIRMPSHNHPRLKPPCLMINNKILPNEISLSHDGAWFAVAIEV